MGVGGGGVVGCILDNNKLNSRKKEKRIEFLYSRLFKDCNLERAMEERKKLTDKQMERQTKKHRNSDRQNCTYTYRQVTDRKTDERMYSQL